MVIYRTKDKDKSAEYSAVATSICVVESVKDQSEFRDFEDFYFYASKYSVFDRNDLYYWYKSERSCKVIKMTYNVALKKRIVRHKLIEEIGLERDLYWGFFELTNEQFDKIIQKGEIPKKLFVQNKCSEAD